MDAFPLFSTTQERLEDLEGKGFFLPTQSLAGV